MQIFLKLPSARTVVAKCGGDDGVGVLFERVLECEGIPEQHIRLSFAGKQLESSSTVADSQLRDGTTVHVMLRLLGGAARMKKEAAEKAHLEEMQHEYQTWHHLADQTEETGVMRLLCVSLVLEKDKVMIHGDEDASDTAFSCAPSSTCYEAPFGGEIARNQGGPKNWYTGWATQEEFNQAFDEIKETFLSLWENLEPMSGQNENEPPTLFWHKTDNIPVTVVLGLHDGIWWNGPKIIHETGNPKNELFNFKELCTEKLMWYASKDEKTLPSGLAHPWRIGGQFAELERWFYHGIGTTTYYNPVSYRTPEVKGGKDGGDGVVAKSQKTPGGWMMWSQRDLDGPLGLTDREKMRLRQMYQLTKKLSSGGKKAVLDRDETELYEGEVQGLIEEGPMHSPVHGIFQWQVKSLKKLLANKCVFWSNTEDHLPNGSVADGTKTAEDDDAKVGKGIELVEFWKYEVKIGTIRKKYILEDRQRLMDTIEQFTPTYKAVLKNRGQDADDDDGDHYMTEDNQYMITNIVALAMDTHMPDYQEDKIACFIKTLIEKRIGPTWHVLVGRSMGYAVQTEARHFIHLFMQHLAFIIWKSEPDPNSGPKQNLSG